ncbi:MAG: lipopolysaccharide biosynthesis protein RfbH [Candidatus Eisenbacteria bacterium]
MKDSTQLKDILESAVERAARSASKSEMEETILSLVRAYCRKFHREQEFVPGKTRIPYAGRVYDENDMASLVSSALEFWLTAGRFAKKFEERFSEYLGVRHVVLTNSGSSANLLALSALTSKKLGERRLRPGDEVITAAASFPTTVNPILQNGLVPVFVDVELGTYSTTPDLVRNALSDRTRAVFLAHTLGNPFDFAALRDAASDRNLFLVEDACDALGTVLGTKPAGAVGDIGTFSFYPPHHITMGEGGAVVTNDPQLAGLTVSFRDWGRDCWCDPGKDDTCGKRFGQKLGELPFGYDHKYVYSEVGYNLKVTDMQAAVGVAQLEKLPGFVEKRRKNFETLQAGLEEYGDRLILPRATPGADPSWFGLPLTVRGNAGFSRAEIIGHLERAGVATRMLFGGNIRKQPYFAGVPHRVSGSLENTDVIMERTFWIGVYPGLTDAMLAYVLETFRGFLTR